MRNVIEYKGFSFYEGTDKQVMDIICNKHATKQRIRVFLGDDKKYWLEEYDIMGTIGRSTGIQKMPLLINNSRSYGGGCILTDCIKMITVDKQVVYKANEFEIKEFTTKEATGELKSKGYTTMVYYEGVNVANFKTKQKADKYIKFMKGESNAK